MNYNLETHDYSFTAKEIRNIRDLDGNRMAEEVMDEKEKDTLLDFIELLRGFGDDDGELEETPHLLETLYPLQIEIQEGLINCKQTAALRMIQILDKTYKKED